MLNMDPPLHTRYRRLVNKGFTPRMVNQLHERIHAATDTIIDSVIEQGSADFVTDIAAELPLVVIAELLGVPNEDRHRDVRLVQPDDRERRTPSTRRRGRGRPRPPRWSSTPTRRSCSPRSGSIPTTTS